MGYDVVGKDPVRKHPVSKDPVSNDPRSKKGLKKARKKAALEHSVQCAAHEAHEAFCAAFERLQVDARAELTAMLGDLRSVGSAAVTELTADRDRVQSRLAQIGTAADDHLATIERTATAAETAASDLDSRGREHLEQTDRCSRDSLARLEAAFVELRTTAEARATATVERIETAATRVEKTATEADARATAAATIAVARVETAATQGEARAAQAAERIERAMTRHEEELQRIFTEFTTRLSASERETTEFVLAARARTADELAELTVGVDRHVQDLQTFARTRIGDALAQVENQSQALLSKAEAAAEEIPRPTSTDDEATPTYFVERELIGADPIGSDLIDPNPIAWGPLEYEPPEPAPVDYAPVGFEPLEFEPLEFEPLEFEPSEYEPGGFEYEPVDADPVEHADGAARPDDDTSPSSLDDDPVFDELVAGMRREPDRADPEPFDDAPVDNADADWAITAASFGDAPVLPQSGSFDPVSVPQGSALQEQPGIGAVDVIATRPVNVTVSLREVAACALQLTRTAGQVVRIAVVHSVSQGSRESYLRLTTSDTVGWWEYEDVPAVTDNDAKASAVVDLAELRDALDAHDRFEGGSDAPIRLEHNVVIGNHLILARDAAELPGLSDDRKIIERVDLRATDRRGLILETQVGRLLLPLDLVAQFRARQVATADLVLVNGLPCLSAEVAGAGATGPRHFLARLQEFDEFDVPVASERRGPTGSEVSQLISALSPSTTPEELERILKIGVGYTRRRAAAHPALRQELILDLVREGTEAIRAAAASNTSLGREACDLAVGDTSSLVRAMVAANPAIPTPALVQLATDSAAQVRSHAASNPAIPDELLRELADDEESSVRASVAAHPKVEIETLLVLARDPDPLVCEAVANNPACPTEALQELIGVVPDLVLSNPKASEALLVAGSQVDSARLRMIVARNPATPAKQLRRLARDPDLDVVAAVVEHPSTPAGTRRRARRRLNPSSDEARDD